MISNTWNNCIVGEPPIPETPLVPIETTIEDSESLSVPKEEIVPSFVELIPGKYKLLQGN